MKLYQLLKELKDDTKIELSLNEVGYIGEVKSTHIQRYENYEVKSYKIDDTVSHYGRSPFIIELGDE